MGSTNPIKLVILDLDGTLIQSETLVLQVAGDVVRSHGKELTNDAIEKSLGRRPLDAWEAVADALGIPASAQQLYDQSEPLLRERWHEAPLLPGAARLVDHLRSAGIPLALATSTPLATLQRKLSNKPALRDAFLHVCCGDDAAVRAGKPAPDCFLEVARRAGVRPEECLVVEDAPCGVQAAVAAGMRVVVVPSLRDAGAYPAADAAAPSGCVQVLPSLLDLLPERFGLPPFADTIAGTVPVSPLWRIAGTVVRGFGRGSKQLGIPTANLDAGSLRGALAEAVTGIYCGWASVGSSPAVYQMCMSVGFNPFFKEQRERTCEPWLLHDFEGREFYGEQIRLLVCAYIRPEANFTSLEALIERIHQDADVTQAALVDERYKRHEADAFLAPPASADGAA